MLNREIYVKCVLHLKLDHYLIILPHYYKYVTENPHTTLVRIYGMHRVKMYHLRRKVHFVIMGSVFDTPEQIHTIYDLKGSMIGRESTQKERDQGDVLNVCANECGGVKNGGFTLPSGGKLIFSTYEKSSSKRSLSLKVLLPIEHLIPIIFACSNFLMITYVTISNRI